MAKAELKWQSVGHWINYDTLFTEVSCSHKEDQDTIILYNAVEWYQRYSVKSENKVPNSAICGVKRFVCDICLTATVSRGKQKKLVTDLWRGELGTRLIVVKILILPAYFFVLLNSLPCAYVHLLVFQKVREM